jgi:hypothetical protein
MNRPDNGVALVREIRLEQGFEVYVLRNDLVEVLVVPELGARIISLKNLRTGREWMWHPAGGLRLFRNQAEDDFSTSPLAGMDECLPTVAPCVWQQRRLPDHGEVWSKPWGVDREVWEGGRLKTSVWLTVSPFNFERALELKENELSLSYRLHNRGAFEEAFLWAMHPLLQLRPGDRLVLPVSTRALLSGERWIEAVDSTIPDGGCSKLFAQLLSEGWAGICNQGTGDQLRFEWNPTENNTLGLWLSRGGWHGHDHFAIEPTNGAYERLDQVAECKHQSRLAAAGTATWQVRMLVGP